MYLTRLHERRITKPVKPFAAHVTPGTLYFTHQERRLFLRTTTGALCLWDQETLNGDAYIHRRFNPIFAWGIYEAHLAYGELFTFKNDDKIRYMRSTVGSIKPGRLFTFDLTKKATRNYEPTVYLKAEYGYISLKVSKNTAATCYEFYESEPDRYGGIPASLDVDPIEIDTLKSRPE